MDGQQLADRFEVSERVTVHWIVRSLPEVFEAVARVAVPAKAEERSCLDHPQARSGLVLTIPNADLIFHSRGCFARQRRGGEERPTDRNAADEEPRDDPASPGPRGEGCGDGGDSSGDPHATLERQEASKGADDSYDRRQIALALTAPSSERNHCSAGAGKGREPLDDNTLKRSAGAAGGHFTVEREDVAWKDQGMGPKRLKDGGEPEVRAQADERSEPKVPLSPSGGHGRCQQEHYEGHDAELVQQREDAGFSGDGSRRDSGREHVHDGQAHEELHIPHLQARRLRSTGSP